jgi:hypothetical protein
MSMDENDITRLEKLVHLKEKGILTEEEFQEQKALILYPQQNLTSETTQHKGERRTYKKEGEPENNFPQEIENLKKRLDIVEKFKNEFIHGDLSEDILGFSKRIEQLENKYNKLNISMWVFAILLALYSFRRYF